MVASVEQARQSGFKHLIKEMHKLEVCKHEKGEKELAKPKLVKPKNPEEKAKTTPKINDEIKEMVKGFFHQKKKEPGKTVDLFVGKIKKSKSSDDLVQKSRKRRKKV